MKAKMEMEMKMEKDKLELHRGSILKLHVAHRRHCLQGFPTQGKKGLKRLVKV